MENPEGISKESTFKEGGFLRLNKLTEKRIGKLFKRQIIVISWIILNISILSSISSVLIRVHPWLN